MADARALVVCAAPDEGLPALVRELARDAAPVVAVDGGVAVCEAAGVAPHLAVGDFDSTPPGTAARLAAQGIEVIEYPSLKDESDLELALSVLAGRGVTTATVCGAFTGRLDHTLAAVGAMLAARTIRLEIAGPGMRGWLVRAGDESLALSGGDSTVSVLAVGGDACVTVLGCRWPLERATLAPLASRGLSNEITAQRATVTCHDGDVLVVSCDLDGVPAARRA